MLTTSGERPSDAGQLCSSEVWRDGLDGSSRAPYGLGAELRALSGSDATSCASSASPQTIRAAPAKLHDLERRAVEKEMVDRTGEEFLDLGGTWMRGKVTSAPASTIPAIRTPLLSPTPRLL
jgi:hypothetical protein